MVTDLLDAPLEDLLAAARAGGTTGSSPSRRRCSSR